METMSEATTDITEHAAGDLVWATDDRTGVSVLGMVEETSSRRATVDPVGPAYKPGAFEASTDSLTAVDDEDRARTQWDIVSMCLMGALDNLDTGTLQFVSEYINGGHL